MNPHRTPGEVIADGPEPLPKGPAMACAGCGAKRVTWGDGEYKASSPIASPRACVPTARVKAGWFRRCREPGEHLHERCKVCGLEWFTSFAKGS